MGDNLPEVLAVDPLCDTLANEDTFATFVDSSFGESAVLLAS